MKKITQVKSLIILSFLFFYNNFFSQNIIDPCFTSASPSASSDFISSSTLANVYSSDLLNWNGTSWIGGFPAANLTIPPPLNQVNCRAIFLGNGVTWTTGGESVGLKLDSPLISGNSYTFSITYVSHGLGSNGSFSPSFYTSPTPSLGGNEYFVASLTPVGFSWTTNSISFTAVPAQDGDEWIILKTESNGTSGLINSFCTNCNVNQSNCTVSVNSSTICQGSSATIVATPTPSGNYFYQWTVPVGFTNPGNVSSFNSGVAGNYSVTVTNLDNNCTANATGTIIVNPLPTVAVNSAIICQGSTATIVATATPPGNYSYQWTVPIGFTNPGNVSSFTSGIGGNYSVTITNLTTNCTASATGTITVNPQATTVVVNSASICQGSTATIVATPTPSGNYSYQWTVPVGFTNPGNVSSFNSGVAGNYSVTITNLDSNCTANASGTIMVNPLPTVTVNSAIICQGSTANIIATATPPGNYSYQWTVPVGFTNPGNVSSFNSGIGGNYSVTITNLTTNCTASATGTITVSPQPTTVVVNSATICQGSTATIVATPTPSGNYSYQWTVPQGFTNPGNVSSFNSGVAGNYSVTITNLDSNCTANASGTIMVNPLPTVTVNSAIICEGSTANIIATVTPSGNYSYQWTVPVGFTNPGNVSSFNSGIAGNYSVTITNPDSGCSASAATTITVNQTPTVVVNSPIICQEATATIVATPTPSGNYSYQWTVPQGLTNPGNVSQFSTNTLGNYSVIITDLNTNCISSNAEGSLTFFPDFTFTINEYCSQNNFILEIVPIDSSFDLNNSNFEWVLNNTIIGNNVTLDLSSYLKSTSVVETFPLNITFNVINNNSCLKTENLIINNVYCGIQKGISANNDGSNDFFDLTLLGVKKLSIFNRYGIKVFQKNDYTDQWIGQSDKGDELPDGVYYYVIDFKDDSPVKSGWIYLNRQHN